MLLQPATLPQLYPRLRPGVRAKVDDQEHERHFGGDLGRSEDSALSNLWFHRGRCCRPRSGQQKAHSQGFQSLTHSTHQLRICDYANLTVENIRGILEACIWSFLLVHSSSRDSRSYIQRISHFLITSGALRKETQNLVNIMDSRRDNRRFLRAI